MFSTQLVKAECRQCTHLRAVVYVSSCYNHVGLIGQRTSRCVLKYETMRWSRVLSSRLKIHSTYFRHLLTLPSLDLLQTQQTLQTAAWAREVFFLLYISIITLKFLPFFIQAKFRLSLSVAWPFWLFFCSQSSINTMDICECIQKRDTL